MSNYILIGIGLIIFTMLVLNFFSHNSTQTTHSLYSQAVITGTEIGHSLLEEMSTNDFDEAVIGLTAALPSPALLTSKVNFGPDGIENKNDRTTFDDFDDYHGYLFADSTEALGVFFVKVSVDYVSSSNPEIVSTSNTWYKRASLLITNEYLRDEGASIPDTIKLFLINTY